MGEAQQNHQHEQHLLLRHHHQPAATAGGGRQSRQRAGSRMVKGVGEIVEVQGGHIVRSMGRKDRHSKVCTAKGPRDRRVRLSAHTAIKFYDVQDRLGYDRPSKAVDWLIKNAKAAIDELDELPPWDPLTASATASSPSSSGPVETPLGHQQHQQERGGGHLEAAAATTASSGFDYAGSGMLPAALESDAIADTIKSFFPITHCAAGLIPSYPPDFLCRTSSTQQAQQDLRLSLHSFHDPVMLHHHHQSSPTTSVEHHASLYSRPPASLAFDAAAAWSDPNHRLGRWGADDSGSGGHFYGTQHLLPQAVPLYPVLTESSYLSHTRGTLQSSNTNTDSQPVGRSWADGMTVSAIDPFTAQQAGSVLCYASNGGGGGIPGLHFRMQVDGEENGGDGVPSASVSPIARH